MLVSIFASSHPASISPLRQPINCNKHRKIGQPHIGKIQPAVIDQRQSHVANDSVDTCTPESAWSLTHTIIRNDLILVCNGSRWGLHVLLPCRGMQRGFLIAVFTYFLLSARSSVCSQSLLLIVFRADFARIHYAVMSARIHEQITFKGACFVGDARLHCICWIMHICCISGHPWTVGEDCHPRKIYSCYR